MRKYNSYKDSGIEWIGKIPSHWNISAIKHFCHQIFAGGTPNTSQNDYWNGDIDWLPSGVCHDNRVFDSTKKITQKGVDNSSTKFIPKGTALIAMTGATCGHTAYCEIDAFANQSVTAYINDKKRLNSIYLWYLLQSGYYYIDTFKTGGAQGGINVEQCKNFAFCIPPLSEQQAIADFLDTQTARIDSIIASREKKIKLLEELRASIISQAITKGIRKDVEMKDSGIEWIGQIPKHWEVSVFKRFLKEPMKYGANESAEFDNPNWPRYIRITDIDEMGSLKKETFKSLPPEKAKEYLLEKGDVLFARSGATVGKTYIHRGEIKACYAGYLIKGKCKTSLLPEFLFLYTQTNAYDNWKNSVFIQATIQNIGADKYSVMPIVVPPIEEQKIIVEYSEDKISHINANIDKTRCEISLLKEYRASLITEVVTGKRKVTN